MPSLSVHDSTQSGLFWANVSPHVSFFRSLTTTGPSFASCCQKVQTNQRARLERFRRDKGIWRHLIRSHHRLLLYGKKKSSPCGPYFPAAFQQVDAVRRRTRSHGSKQGQNAFSELPFPHLWQNSCAHTTAGHCTSRDFSQHASSQKSAPVGILQALQRVVQGYDWVFEVLFPQLQSCLFPSQNLCELEHGIPSPLSFAAFIAQIAFVF